MNDKPNNPRDGIIELPSDGSPVVGAVSRRSFLRGAGNKALYVTPVLVTLSARQAYANSGDFDSTCGEIASPCTVDAECCENNCGAGDMKCKMA